MSPAHYVLDVTTFYVPHSFRPIARMLVLVQLLILVNGIPATSVSIWGSERIQIRTMNVTTEDRQLDSTDYCDTIVYCEHCKWEPSHVDDGNEVLWVWKGEGLKVKCDCFQRSVKITLRFKLGKGTWKGVDYHHIHFVEISPNNVGIPYLGSDLNTLNWPKMMEKYQGIISCLSRKFELSEHNVRALMRIHAVE
ncbi:uncharacterized protein LOC121280168 isoform X2 [Carcharodon carcharias]|nr:uncharacterized protein LOC121280168 isoform X2 [Carcharodon carcharias]XP_041047814.1 uncharacterized protein LOC121280168 isoform X2 [Carcharodon carcharias]